MKRFFKAALVLASVLVVSTQARADGVAINSNPAANYFTPVTPLSTDAPSSNPCTMNLFRNAALTLDTSNIKTLTFSVSTNGQCVITYVTKTSAANQTLVITPNTSPTISVQ